MIFIRGIMAIFLGLGLTECKPRNTSNLSAITDFKGFPILKMLESPTSTSGRVYIRSAKATRPDGSVMTFTVGETGPIYARDINGNVPKGKDFDAGPEGPVKAFTVSNDQEWLVISRGKGFKVWNITSEISYRPSDRSTFV